MTSSSAATQAAATTRTNTLDVAPRATKHPGAATQSRFRLNLGSVRSIAAAVIIFFGLIVLGGLSPAPASAQEPTGSISGVVTDLDGNPLAGASIELFVAVYDPSYVPLTTFTAANGSYSFLDVDAGEYNIRFGHDAFASEYYDDVHDHDTPAVVTVAAGLATTGIDASLSPLLRISGTVIDTNGNPIEGAGIMLFDDTNDPTFIFGLTAGTIVNGTYELFAPPGTYRIRFSGPDFAAQWWDSATTLSSSSVLSLVTEDIDDIDAQLGLASTVNGTVYDIDGQPVPNGYVQLFDEVGYMSSTSTDSNGYYTMDGAGAGPHIIRAGNNPGFGIAGEIRSACCCR